VIFYMVSVSDLVTQLNDFSPAARAQALSQLVALTQQGKIPMEAEREVANLHCHTFFSFNAYGYSPSGLAWLAKQRGFKLLGIVDFDILDGVDEFIQACECLGVRGSTGMETRVYLPEYATREINSPGEPGVYYYMGIGFTSSQPPTMAAPILANMRRRAEQRNRVMVERINAYLSPIAVDYDHEVLPLTPSGNATERHMLAAYIRVVADYFSDAIPFWAEKLQMTPEQVAAQIGDGPKFQNVVRFKLMKRGGVGYVQPGPDSFPSVEEVNQLVTGCGALPCATWLDGLSAGEQAMEELLNLLIGKGAVALNIVPDRNWNIPDADIRCVKVQNLYAVVALAEKLDLPLNIGTEMNAPGQKLLDDFDAPELAPVRQAFLDGAYFIYGHTVMQRGLGMGYQSQWAQQHLPTRRERNAFYTRLGRLITPGKTGLEHLQKLDAQSSPAKLLNSLKELC
jgi:hypothetical protein